MIIDFRVRPPFSGFLKSELYCDLDFHSKFANRFGFELPQSVKEHSIELMLEEMKECGVDKVVIPARKLYNVTNDDLVDLLSKYPDKFFGMAGIDPLDGEKALDEIHQYVINGPCVGITMEPGYCAEPLRADDERLHAVYQICEEKEIPIFLSFGGLVAPLMEFNNPEIIDRVAKKYPDLIIILAHGGYPYPEQSCYVCFKNKNVYLVPDFYGTRVPGGAHYREAMTWIPDKIIFGSGYPVQPIGGMLKYYRENMSEEAFEHVSHKNAAKILKLEKEI